MNKYKKNLIIRMCVLSFVVLVAIFLGIFDVFFATVEIKTSMFFGFQCGLLLAMGMLAILLIIRYKKAMESEEKLQLLFNKENDERMKNIKSKAGMPMLLITSFIIIIIAVIIGYFNVVVFYTLIAVALCQLVAACIVKFIYMRLM